MSSTVLKSRRVLYVGGLADGMKETTLRAAMIPFGPIHSIDIPLDYAKGIHKGFGFVEYEDSEDAADAMDNMDGAELMGKVLSVSLAQPNQIRSHDNRQAVWSTDEWFQQQSGVQQQAEVEQEKKDQTQLQKAVQ